MATRELDNWIPAAEAARLAGVSRPRIHQLVMANVLDGTHMGDRLLVHRPSLDIWREGRRYRRAARPFTVAELRRRPDLKPLMTAHGVERAWVFGSVARGEGRPGSDLDLLIRMEPERGALDVAAHATDLEDSLGCDVDLMVDRGDGALPQGIRTETVALWD